MSEILDITMSDRSKIVLLLGEKRLRFKVRRIAALAVSSTTIPMQCQYVVLVSVNACTYFSEYTHLHQ